MVRLERWPGGFGYFDPPARSARDVTVTRSESGELTLAAEGERCLWDIFPGCLVDVEVGPYGLSDAERDGLDERVTALPRVDCERYSIGDDSEVTTLTIDGRRVDDMRKCADPVVAGYGEAYDAVVGYVDMVAASRLESGMAVAPDGRLARCTAGGCFPDEAGCDHDVCTVGAAMLPTCSPCVAGVCGYRSCCKVGWGSDCVERAVAECGVASAK
ncbi:MAG: hypothetical protein HY744_05930 [Deltaproteobacteria bacterium]|nr:hypothetical protein [Deltaproteobacteria bacterium]